ncbi:MOXD2 protein, partial [Anseranas semipalmata]|nr:MOXD2 protein [Anseranas semipalmata]
MDTARLVSAFGTDDTVQFFNGQKFSKSLFLMRFRSPSNSNDPKIFFTYDLRLDKFAVPAEETKYACTFIPLPMVKQKHHIYKVNSSAVLLWKTTTTTTTTGQDRLVPSIMLASLSLTAF